MPVKRGADEGLSDDTEGNAARFKGVSDGADDAETEGNLARVKVRQDDADDTEGNVVRGRGVADGEDDDTEGNGISRKL